MPSKELTKAKAIQKRLLKEKADHGAIIDSQGNRYYIPELLMQANELEKGKEYYDWYQKEFPDDIGEPNMFIQWMIMFYCLGEHEMALRIARRIIYLNVHIIPQLLERPLAPIDGFWYGTAYADPDYITESEVYEMALPADFLGWLSQEYDKTSMQSLVSKYITLRQKLNDTREVEKRRIIWEQEKELFKEEPILKTNFVYQLKITLDEIEPPIWRRILVKADTKLPALHRIIQTIFGWTNSHLHQFSHETKLYTNPSLGEAMEDDMSINYTFISIKDLLHIERQAMHYEYDFGDSWMHTIVLEKISPILGNEMLPLCIEGERNSPPDDSGGVYGYENLLEILADKSHEEYEETKAWVGKGFNPEKCNILSINKKLMKKNYGVQVY